MRSLKRSCDDHLRERERESNRNETSHPSYLKHYLHLSRSKLWPTDLSCLLGASYYKKMMSIFYEIAVNLCKIFWSSLCISDEKNIFLEVLFRKKNLSLCPFIICVACQKIGAGCCGPCLVLLVIGVPMTFLPFASVPRSLQFLYFCTR